MRSFRNILVTGGCGFIGTNFIRFMFAQPEFTGRIINLDALTYAGNPDNLTDIAARYGALPLKSAGATTRNGGDHGRYVFRHADIRDPETVNEICSGFNVDAIVHFAAESHVDRSILGPRAFMETNVLGTFNLLEAASRHWGLRGKTNGSPAAELLFHHVSTDEVFGSLGESGYFREESPYDPKSPYSASKTASDHLVRAYGHTYGLPFTISNCSNNYGPYQFPEKMLPLMILNLLDGKELPVYGDGRNIRDWLHVEDHARAIWTVLRHGKAGGTYLVGGENEWENIDLIKTLCAKIAARTGIAETQYLARIRFVADRPGHDRRYAIDCSRIKRELGWKRRYDFSEGLDRTIDWYLANSEWIGRIREGSYRAWIETNYTHRKSDREPSAITAE